MKNAKLVINNPQGFANDIWQYNVPDADFKWSDAIKGFADTLQDIYDFFCTEEGDGIIDDGHKYVLGDVINMLYSIDVKVR